MKNWCICWFFSHILLGILIFKRFTVRRLFKSFGIKGLMELFRATGKLKKFFLATTDVRKSLVVKKKFSAFL
jgi:hypothetical protein